MEFRMTDLEKARVLRDAVEVIRTCGWHQGDMGKAGLGWCAVGAIFEAGGWSRYEAIEAVEAALGLTERFDATLIPLAEWNDTPGRTAGEVMDVFESTALALEVRTLAVESTAHNKELVRSNG